MKKTPLKTKKFLPKQSIKHKPGFKKTGLRISKPKPKPHKIKIKSDSAIGKLIAKTDQVHSMLVRIMNSNNKGIVKCYTCDFKAFWKASGIECGHWQSRSNMGTRYSLIGSKPQCHNCNSVLNGNLKVFEENLIKEHDIDTVEMIKHMAKKVVRYSEEELRRIKAELSYMLKNIRKEKGL